jgi:hypothetical protein
VGFRYTLLEVYLLEKKDFNIELGKPDKNENHNNSQA